LRRSLTAASAAAAASEAQARAVVEAVNQRLPKILQAAEEKVRHYH